MGAVDDRQHWVVVGQLTRPHGVRGAVRARWYSPLAALLAPPRALRLRRGSAVATLVLLEDRALDPTASLLRLEGLDGLEAAAAWRGAAIEVPRTLVPPASDDEVYLFELLGRSVRTTAGRRLGVAARLYDYGAGPVLGIAPERVPAGAPAAAALDENGPPAVGLATNAPPPAGRRGRRGRRPRVSAAEELLVPLLAGVLRELDAAGEVVLDLAAAHLDAP